MTADDPGVGTERWTVHPSPRLKTLYNIYLLIIVWCFVIPGLLVITMYIDPLTRVFASVAALILALLAIAMIGKSWESVAYTFHDGVLEVRSGFPAGKRIRIPYPEITGTGIVRRRLPAYLGMATVSITYAKPSGENTTIYLRGIEDPEGFCSRIHDLAAGKTA